MNTDPYPRDAQNRARLLDVGLSCAILGFVGVLIGQPPTHRHAIWHRRFYLGAILLTLAGIAMITLWAILAVRAAWRKRRERNQRGFDVLPAHAPNDKSTFDMHERHS
jgi:hypothetical protein